MSANQMVLSNSINASDWKSPYSIFISHGCIIKNTGEQVEEQFSGTPNAQLYLYDNPYSYVEHRNVPQASEMYNTV